MKAVVIRRFGGPEVLQIADVPLQQPGRGQVRVRVEAAAVNPVDVATRAGWLADAGLMVADDQIGIGWDLAGVVDAVGPAVDGYEVGDPVIGMRHLLSEPIGAQAEQLVLDSDAIAPAPRRASFVEASTLPLNGLTALQALDLLELQPGEWLLVTGAAGALGGFALQLAALRGLRTIAVASGEDESLVRRLGAHEFVARTAHLGAAVRGVRPGGVDGALDAALVGVTALDAVRDGGSFVAVSAGAAPPPLRGTRVQNVWIRSDAAQLTDLAALVDAGHLALRVAATHALVDVAAAHRRLAAGGLRGRIVLTPAKGNQRHFTRDHPRERS
jgi:NADPH2:quinone reductase